jgi:hypothetical protein
VAPPAVRHRTERDAQGRVWRFVYDPAAQDAAAPAGTVRVRCTTGNARATIVVEEEWLAWPRQQLLDRLAAALHLQRNGAAAPAAATNGAAATGDRRIARRRLVRDVRGAAWNCVYDPSIPAPSDDDDRVRVRCTAGRDRIELVLDAAWHRLGDRQLAELIGQALDARK